MVLAALALLLSAGLWLAPDPHRDQVLSDIRAFGKAHPTEIPPEDCAVPMGMGPWLTQGTKPASADYETLCAELRQAELRSGALRLSLGYEQNGPLDWLLHPLVFANPILALLGCALLFLGVGPYLEERWGRRTYLGVIAVAALGSAGARTMVCNSGSLPWTGAQGWLGALVAAFTVVFLTAQVQFIAPTWPPRMIPLPGWSVAAWWLMVRLVAMWTTGADRASVIGELAGWGIGLGAGLAVHLGWLAQVQNVAGPRLGAGLERMRRLTQKEESLSQRGQPPPEPEPEPDPEPERDDAPTADAPFDFDAEPAAAPAEPKPAVPTPVGPLPRRPPRQLELPSEDPPLQPQESPDHAGPALELTGTPAEPTEAMPAAAVQQWAQTAVPAPNNLNWLLPGRAQAVGPQPSAPSAVSVGAVGDDLLAALDAVMVQPPARTATAVDEATTLVGNLPPVRGPRPQPSGEVTQAYLPRDAVRTAVTEALHRGVVPSEVALVQDLGRDASGTLQAQCDGAWQALDPKHIQAVAVGVVVHRDNPSQAPQIYIDCIQEWGERDRPARALRLCANAAMLQRLAPGQESGHAFAGLARELAGAGAARLPERAVWPGPPWPRYDTLADFMRMWQRSG